MIEYKFKNGIKADGTPYSGTRRKAYLPADDKGIETLGLLILCFKRKLSFLVGTSLTTGEQNTVVWSGIHHKTSPVGGFANFGYPDDGYFDRVKDEAEARGAKIDEIEKPVPLMGNLESH